MLRRWWRGEAYGPPLVSGGGKDDGAAESKSVEKGSGKSVGRGPGAEGGASPVRAACVASTGEARAEESREGTGNSKLVGLVGVVLTSSVMSDIRLRRNKGILLESALRLSTLRESGLLAG